MDPAVRLRQAWRALLVVSILCLGLAGALTIVCMRARAETGDRLERIEPTVDDPAVRKAAIEELVSKAAGGWDTFPDAEVARILQPGIKPRKVEEGRFTLRSNEQGLRDGDFEMPKPADVVRVVLLGDSFVFGEGVNENERFGAFLQQYLVKNAAPGKRRIECLHFGMTCWNIVAETSFLRRALSLVQPDLVIHLVIRNDAEDNPGARGFGRISNFDPLHSDRGEPLFQARHPAIFGRRKTNWISYGLDYESRMRLEDAGRRIARLADLVVRSGGRYLMVDYYVIDLPKSKHFLASSLEPDQVCFLPSLLAKQDEMKADDFHWNKIGSELVAKSLYAVIRERKLLPQLELADWPEATAVAREWLGKGEAEASAPVSDEPPGRRKIGPSIDFTDLDDAGASQVTGGVVPAFKQRVALAGLYAALILAGGGARRLHVRGHGLQRIELDGTSVELFVEEEKVGSFVVNGGDRIDLDLDVPESVAKRPYVSVRFVANDFAYCASDWRQFVVFALEKVELTAK